MISVPQIIPQTTQMDPLESEGNENSVICLYECCKKASNISTPLSYNLLIFNARECHILFDMRMLRKSKEYKKEFIMSKYFDMIVKFANETCKNKKVKVFLLAFKETGRHKKIIGVTKREQEFFQRLCGVFDTVIIYNKFKEMKNWIHEEKKDVIHSTVLLVSPSKAKWSINNFKM